jgi:tellurite resistance protein TerC
MELLPFSQYWWLYAVFTGFVFLALILDLGVFHRKAHEVSFREASIWSLIWVCLGLTFNYLLYRFSLWQFSSDPRLSALENFNPEAAARQVGLEFLAGYLVEKALSVDNIFVFVLLFGYFQTPRKYQHRILFFGIVGALIFRAGFIALGSILMQFHWVILVFGGLLIFTGIKMFFLPEKKIDPSRNLILRIFQKCIPVTRNYQGQRFLVRVGRKLYATPLLVALLMLEVTDIVFALDSVPAIFALTREPFIVFSSNIFAILGLRALYFMLAGAIHRFHLLKFGLAIILVFVGLKMIWLNSLWNGKFPIGISLMIIGVILVVSIAFSLLFPRVVVQNSPANVERFSARNHKRLRSWLE